jgi:hypothetical protein
VTAALAALKMSMKRRATARASVVSPSVAGM